MLPRSAMIAKLLAVELKNNKKLRKHSNSDCIEMKTLVEGTGTMLEGILNDEDNMYHATPVMIEIFEMTDDEKKKGHAYVKPACTIEDEGLKAMMDVKRQMHRDVFFTRRALHSYRNCIERTKHKPFAKMMLLEIDVSLEDCYPVGLTLGGQNGGFICKHQGVHCFARYKYQHRPTIIMLPRSAMIAKLLAVELKNNKKLRKHSNSDCIEMKTLVEGTGTMLEGILNDEDNMYHATPVMIEIFEMTDDEKKKGHAYVKPACTIEDEGLKAMMDVKRQMHRDVFFTRRALHSYRNCIERTKHKPFAKMMLLEIDVSLEDCYPVGLTLGGHWRGTDGIYKSANNAQIKKAIYIKTGSNGNISDDDAVIKLVRDDYNMKKELSINLRRDLNDHSEHYNNGLFHLNDEEEEEDAIVEPTVNGMVVNDLPEQPDIEPAVQAASEDIINVNKGTQDTNADESENGDVSLNFWELNKSTTKLGKKKLKQAMDLAHNHWVNTQHGHRVTLRVFLKAPVSNRLLTRLLGCKFSLDSDMAACVKKDMGLLA